MVLPVASAGMSAPDTQPPAEAGDAPRRTRLRALTLVLRLVGIAAALLAVGLCGRIIVSEWPTISRSLATADLRLLVAAFIAGAVGMWLLAVLWWRCLRVFRARRPLRSVSAWYFAGELGKYLPGGIWPVVGRGELARRDGVARATAYATTLVSLAVMCVGAGIAGGILVPFFAFDGGRLGPELLIVALIPAGVIGVHPKLFGAALRWLGRISKGRIDIAAPRWRDMLGLIALATPTWLAIGGASVLIAEALGYQFQPARVAFAAIVAWIIGFLAVPVPAGAGVRELLFVLVCGLGVGPATAVAAVARVFLLAVDGVGGLMGLFMVRRSRKSAIGRGKVDDDAPGR